MKNEKFEDLLERIPKEDFQNYYLLHSIRDTANYFNIGFYKCKQLVDYFGIVKTKQDKSKALQLKRINKYGSLDTFREISNKHIREAFIAKYGVSWNSQIQAVKEKKIKTFQSKYGTNSALESKEVRDKIAKTNLERYGAENVFASKEIQQRIIQTNLDRYGVENCQQNSDIHNKTTDTVRQKYGRDIALDVDKAKQSNLNKYGVEFPLQSQEIRDKTMQSLYEHFGVKYPSQLITSQSKINNDFANLLKQNNIDFQREYLIGNKSFDFKIGNILLEVDPTPTHNSTWGIYNTSGLDKYYHYNKTKLAKEHGFRCVHLWDWDNRDIVIDMLKDKPVVYARKCEIRQVAKKDCDDFLNKYHLQGTCRNQSIRLGLYYNNYLIQVMTFGKPRYNKQSYELLRLCSSDYKIVGGAEKLFKYFIRTYNPQSIISYCDNSKFNGDVYYRLGFELKTYGQPSKHWYSIQRKIHITNNLLVKRGFDQLFNENYGKGTSNEELMKNHKFVEIYDAGQSTFEWTNKS